MVTINYDSELRRAGANANTFWRRVRFLARRHVLGTVGFVIMVLFVLAAVFADAICRYSPLTVDSAHALAAPSLQHWLGTDSFGRDVWARIIHGARISLAVGIEAAFLIGGLIVTETVFNIPGVARFLVEAIRWRDYPIVQNLVMLIAVVVVVTNFTVDMLYAVFDPRIRYD